MVDEAPDAGANADDVCSLGSAPLHDDGDARSTTTSLATAKMRLKPNMLWNLMARREESGTGVWQCHNCRIQKWPLYGGGGSNDFDKRVPVYNRKDSTHCRQVRCFIFTQPALNERTLAGGFLLMADHLLAHSRLCSAGSITFEWRS